MIDMIASHKNFGIFTPHKVEVEDGGQIFKYLVFKDVDGVEWHDLVSQFGPFDQFIAVDETGHVVSMEKDPDSMQVGGLEIIGLNVGPDFSWTRGPGGNVYGKIWNGTVIIEPEQKPSVIILPSVTLWERLTEQEANQVNTAMATQPVRTQRIFTTANTFRSDHELWPLLEQMATELFGAERASELLVA